STALPVASAAAVAAGDSTPTSLAKWLNVPVCRIARGSPRSRATAATAATEPSPPATPLARGAPSTAVSSRLVTSSPVAVMATVRAAGSSSLISSVGSTGGAPERGFITPARPRCKNAAADAAWPDGNDEDVGGSGRVRQAGSASAPGRRRGNKGLPSTLLVKLAPPIASTPRTAARRVTPRRDASTAAIVNQSTPWV